MATCRGKTRSWARVCGRLVRLKVDVIVSAGPTITRAAKKNYYDSHCDGPGQRSCWQRIRRESGPPGGNITGLSSRLSELSGKQLEILKEIVPTLSRVVVIGSSNEPGDAQALSEAKLAAGAFKVKFQTLD